MTPERNHLGAKRKRRRIPEAADQLILYLYHQGVRKAPQITRELEQQLPRALVPTERTVRDYVNELNEIYRSEAWTVATGTDEEIAAVPPVLYAVVEATHGRVSTVTREEARWVARLASATSGLEGWRVYRLVREYVRREKQGLATTDLDLFLSYRPWQRDAVGDHPPRMVRATEYSNAVARGYFPEAPLGLWDYGLATDEITDAGALDRAPTFMQFIEESADEEDGNGAE